MVRTYRDIRLRRQKSPHARPCSLQSSFSSLKSESLFAVVLVVVIAPPPTLIPCCLIYVLAFPAFDRRSRRHRTKQEREEGGAEVGAGVGVGG